MSLEEITGKAEELAKKYNPNEVSPFPYKNILTDRKDLEIYLVEYDETVSGAITYNKERKIFEIFINQNKPQVRQNFTIAHELGHYFLHQKYIKQEEGLVDGENILDGNPVLFRSDTAQATQLEIEANNFAAALIMPKEWVMKAWNKLHNIESCARVFKVSVTAMSIRLQKLGLVD